MFKKMKLASKLAIVMGACLAVVFTILIVMTATMSGSAISTSVSGELKALSSANGYQVQQIFDMAGSVANDINSYLVRAYKIAEEDPDQMIIPEDEASMKMTQSEVYNKTLTSLNYDVELYLRESCRNAATNNDDIAGAGILFEPYAFQEDMRDFGFYIPEGQGDADVKPFGAYSKYSTEIYYKEAAAAKQTVVTDPYDFNGIKMVSYATPIVYNDVLQGVVVADINVSNFSKVNSTSEEYPSMYACIYDDSQTIVYDSRNLESVGHNMSEFVPDQTEVDTIKASMGQGQAFQTNATREDGRSVILFFTPIAAGSETWWSLTALDEADVNASVTQTTVLLVILAVAALILLIFVTIYVLRRMLKPLQPVVEAAERIANGDLDVQLTNDSQDEIGILSQSFMGMTTNLKAMVDDVDYLLSSMAEGNFNIHSRAPASYVGSFAGFIKSIRKMHRKLSVALHQINTSADQVSAGSEQVSMGAQALSQGATEQASSVQELAASINEISEQVNTNAQSAEQASKLAQDTGTKMLESNRQMNSMIAAMGEISDKSGQIGKIIKTIEDIAFQTNILALNAAVEAARAGAAGKGFAVVADEVRNLASKSAEASKSTASLIAGSIQAVENGTKIADATARTVLETVEGAQQVTVLVEQISKASGEQASSIAQVTLGIDQISAVVQTNSATAEESAAASEELSGQAQMLKSLVSQFELRDVSELQE